MTLAKHRLENMRRLANISLLINSLNTIVGPVGSEELAKTDRGFKTLTIMAATVRREYYGPDALSRVQRLQTIYDKFACKNVRHVNYIYNKKGSTVYTKPRGLAVLPLSETELIAAVGCVLEALEVIIPYFLLYAGDLTIVLFVKDMHAAPDPVFHRDIQWSHVIQQADHPLEWLLVDFDDATCPSTIPAANSDSECYAPPRFRDVHGAEVDIWAAGKLITDAFEWIPGTSLELRDLGLRLQRQEVHSAKDALILMRELSK
ncbi:hypothetical protein BOTBODRAFT_180084 [Botryobasidium botryosum FD-172 SS1]|uniref:Protein kinase domain-containing protein n=1 Tax=Botryobasidium botryosum (strain FD-172 SS1) TaxID=930990 RepID=A0A067M9A0_BOTB1|nr:hypothetical protein BOTBODRAFT_180084 [Botryobasidium botryosum FD-172 SS1]